MLPAQPAASWVTTTRYCKYSRAPDDGRKHRPKHVELTWNNELIYIVLLVGYLHNCITMHGFMNVKFIFVCRQVHSLQPLAPRNTENFMNIHVVVKYALPSLVMPPEYLYTCRHESTNGPPSWAVAWRRTSLTLRALMSHGSGSSQMYRILTFVMGVSDRISFFLQEAVFRIPVKIYGSNLFNNYRGTAASYIRHWPRARKNNFNIILPATTLPTGVSILSLRWNVRKCMVWMAT